MLSRRRDGGGQPRPTPGKARGGWGRLGNQNFALETFWTPLWALYGAGPNTPRLKRPGDERGRPPDAIPASGWRGAASPHPGKGPGGLGAAGEPKFCLRNILDPPLGALRRRAQHASAKKAGRREREASRCYPGVGMEGGSLAPPRKRPGGVGGGWGTKILP